MTVSLNTCSQCHSSFHCGFALEGSACWCSYFPPVIKIDNDDGCLCQPCLKEKIIQQINQFIATRDATGKNIDLTKYQTENSIEGIDYYTENGLIVFSAWYLLKRGSCCSRGCRHCPF